MEVNITDTRGEVPPKETRKMDTANATEMNATEAKLREILGAGDRFDSAHVTVRKTKTGFSITYGAMYDAPGLNVERIMQLVELFGTKKIDVDNYRNSGCESCDYGSDYGHEIEVMEPTAGLDLPEFTTRER